MNAVTPHGGLTPLQQVIVFAAFVFVLAVLIAWMEIADRHKK